MRIGEVARLTGIPGRRIRFYEERGLLEPAGRSPAGYRLYGEREVARLEFVKRAKTLGLTLREIRSLISVTDGCGREEVACRLEEVLDEKLRKTRREISNLLILEANLRRFKKTRRRPRKGRPPNLLRRRRRFLRLPRSRNGRGGENGEYAVHLRLRVLRRAVLRLRLRVL